MSEPLDACGHVCMFICRQSLKSSRCGTSATVMILRNICSHCDACFSKAALKMPTTSMTALSCQKPFDAHGFPLTWMKSLKRVVWLELLSKVPFWQRQAAATSERCDGDRYCICCSRFATPVHEDRKEAFGRSGPASQYSRAIDSLAPTTDVFAVGLASTVAACLVLGACVQCFVVVAVQTAPAVASVAAPSFPSCVGAVAHIHGGQLVM